MAILTGALTGDAVPRPLIVPLFAVLAGEAEALDVAGYLADAGKRSRLLSEVSRAVAADVLCVDPGTGWDLAAGGAIVDWSAGYPPAIRPGVAPPAFDSGHPSAALLGDVLSRVRAVVAPTVPLAVAIAGPARLDALSGATLGLAAATREVLGAARFVTERGGTVIVVREEGGADVDLSAYARLTAPLWSSLRFFRAAGVLALRGAADAWVPVVQSPAPLLPSFDPAACPALAAALAASRRCFGLTLTPGDAAAAHAELIATGRCAVITHDDDLGGRVPIRDLTAACRRLAA
jgi:hypothetical protein